MRIVRDVSDAEAAFYKHVFHVESSNCLYLEHEAGAALIISFEKGPVVNWEQELQALLRLWQESRRQGHGSTFGSLVNE